ncbi:MAG: GtrA family protein [Candidatus Acidiferrales bacterium]
MKRAGRCLRFGRFSLVGLMGAVLQLLLVSLLTECFGIPGVAAAAIAVEIAILHNFFWHERFTWRDRRLKSARQAAARLWRFHAGNGLVSLLGNTALVYWLVEWLKTPVLPSAAGAIALCSAVNFLVADRWVYAANPTATDSNELS